MFVYLVIDDLPPEFGEMRIIGCFNNKRAANEMNKSLRQLDDYANQYVRIRRYKLQTKSTLIPVKKQR